jgi:hypothetical protein
MSALIYSTEGNEENEEPKNQPTDARLCQSLSMLL